MKLPAIIRGDTAARLEKARAERDRVEAVLSDLASQRDALDFSADDYSTVSLTIDGQIQVHRRALDVADRQITGLEAKVAEEQNAELSRTRQKAIAAVEAMLPERLDLIKQGVTVAKAVVGFSGKLSAWRKRFLEQYPPGLEHPYQHHLSDDWVMRNIFAALRLSPEEAHEILDDLVPGAAQMHADAIADLKANPISNIETEAA